MHLDYEETALPNGVRVATTVMPHVGSVALGIWVGVGGRYESRRLSGISHFIEHLLFKGTRTRSPRDISQAIEGRGGYLNAFTQEESTCYYARIAAEHTWTAFDILSDMYRNPRLAKADIAKERGVIVEEIMMYRDRPQSLVEEMLGELLWRNHPLGRALIGTPKNIRRMSRQDLLRFKADRYIASNTLVVFAGQVEHRACVGRVRSVFGRASRKRLPSCVPVTVRTLQERISVITKKIEQGHLAMGIRLFGRHDARRYALKLLSIILGENMSSRLFQQVRERHGLAYSVHSSIQLFEETGVLAIQAGLDRHRTAKALDLVARELDRLKEKRVSARELRRAKDYAIGQLRISLESTASQMMWVGENIMGYGHFVQPEKVIARLEAVTGEEIQQVATQVLRGRRASAAMVVPEDVDRHVAMLEKQIRRL